MEIYVREKEFTDKKDKNRIVKYNEFYVKINVKVQEVEEVELILKIEDKFAKTLLLENLSTANFTINSNIKEDRTYHNPVITFNVGKNEYKVPVKMSNTDVTLFRVAIAQDFKLGF